MRVSLVERHSREQGQAERFELFQKSCIRVSGLFDEFFYRLQAGCRFQKLSCEFHGGFMGILVSSSGIYMGFSWTQVSAF